MQPQFIFSAPPKSNLAALECLTSTLAAAMHTLTTDADIGSRSKAGTAARFIGLSLGRALFARIVTREEVFLELVSEAHMFG